MNMSFYPYPSKISGRGRKQQLMWWR